MSASLEAACVLLSAVSSNFWGKIVAEVGSGACCSSDNSSVGTVEFMSVSRECRR